TAAGRGPAASRPQAEEEKSIALVLTRDLVRGEGRPLPTLSISPDVSRVRLEVAVQPAYAHYEAVLQTVEGKELLSSAKLEPQPAAAGQKIAVLLPASLLPAGDYILTLRGLPPSGLCQT